MTWKFKGWEIQHSPDDMHYLVVSPLQVVVLRFPCEWQAIQYASIVAQEDYDERNNIEFDPAG